MGEFLIDLGSTIPYFVDRFLELVGKDLETVELRRWFEETQRIGFQESSFVMAVGMHTPVPLEEIYQPTRIVFQGQSLTIYLPAGGRRNIRLPENAVFPPERFLSLHTNAVIYAGPGWGKTTFLHYLFLKTWRERTAIPVLFTLRRPAGLADFRRFIEVVHRLKKRKEHLQFLLLVDGYDEVSDDDRKFVSNALLRYGASGLGQYLLTCRDFYDVYDLTVPHARIKEFDTADQERYVEAFMKAYDAQVPATDLLNDLKGRGLADVLKHPLLLALVCIVKTGKMQLHSRSVLGLIERAIETLSFRWDEGKGVERESRTPLDGRDRINCLKRIAFNTREKHVSARPLCQQ